MFDGVSDVKIVSLPELPAKGDVSDWLRAGGTAATLLDTAAAAPPLTAQQHRPLSSPGAAPEPQWPEPPGPAAFAGIVGRFLRLVEPFTEADPVAIVAQFLIAFASAIGWAPHAVVGATRHSVRNNIVLVGKSAKARKGDSWSPVESLFREAIPDWARANIKTGLSSGEGMIWEVRDEIHKSTPIKEKGRIVGYQDEIVDAGIADKRLLIVEPELARVLRVMGREGNTLSASIRQAWDSGDLRIMTKNNAATASGAHIAIIGHITLEELRRELPDTETVNGFGNRFTWLVVRRSKLLPEPEPFERERYGPLAAELRALIAWASQQGTLARDAEARALWCDLYGELSADRDGLVGSMLARAEAHVLRLSLLYALLDHSATVRVSHLQSAIELWAYAERSVEYIFGDALGDPTADTILQALRQHGELNRTAISDLFGRNVPSARLHRALQRLLTAGKAHTVSRSSGGRHEEVWLPSGPA